MISPTTVSSRVPGAQAPASSRTSHSTLASKAEFTSLSDRMSYLLALRVAMGVIVVAWSVLRPEALVLPLDAVLGLTVAYLLIAVAGELARRGTGGRLDYWILTSLLLVDGVYLAVTMYATGATQSPIRFLVFLDLVAVSLLASYRTGLKIALWHSLLLFVVVYAEAAALVAPVDVAPGVGITFDRMPVLNVTAFWLFAIATSIFSALNERELRLRRADLQSLVDVGTKLDSIADAVQQSDIVLQALVERFGFPRGLLLGESDGRVVVLATHGIPPAPTTATDADWIVRRAWERHDILPVKQLDASRDPFLAGLLPDARNLIVAPMIAEGRTLGAIVVEHRTRRTGVERRIAAMLGQFASIAALNLRNATLLQHVQDLAERDSLTGAANRRMFQLSLERTLHANGREAKPDQVTAVLFLDLDDFKVVNDTLGHAAGDALLVAVTDRISRLVRADDLVARLGGDEFAILTDDEPMLSKSRSMAARLVHELRVPYVIGDKHVVVTASVGIASARDAVAGAADLVRNADVAMYMAKANGKSGFAIFDPGMHEAMRERHELSVDLQRAVDLDQLTLLYQPIMDLQTGRIAGVEGLLRWHHPTHGLVMPGKFIEIAEESGAILPIGHWVLRQACREVAGWIEAGTAPADMSVSVNVSAREIQQLGFLDSVKAVLAESGLDPTRLMLEITETALLRATPSTIATLNGVRAMGVRTVIDDFGTGYFSLSHLRQFPIDTLKIASEFVQDTDTASKSSALAGAIVAMSRSLDIETVAEGIETEEQATRMRDLGCAYGQGYAFALPLTGEELLATFGPKAPVPTKVKAGPTPRPAKRVRAPKAAVAPRALTSGA